MEVCESREEPWNAMGQMEDDSGVHMEIDDEFIAIQGLLDANKVVFGDAERGASGSHDSEVQAPAAVQGRAAEVGDFAIVHYGSDVHLGEIIQVDREPNKFRVVFFKSFRAGESYTFRYEKGKATSWVREGCIYNIVRPPLPISKGRFCLANDDLDVYKCIRADVNPGGC